VDKPKILVIDIEWRPTKALVWRPFKENISPQQILEDGGLLCIGAKFLGDGVVTMFSEWEHGHKGMLRGVRDMMNVADAIIGYNSDRYDLPKLEGEFIRYGLKLPPKVASIDLYKTVKKLGYFRNSLGFIAPFLGIGNKIEHEGFMFWRRVMEGDAKTQKKMLIYCAQDVKLTERLYKRILPAIRNHPHLFGKEECPACGSRKTHKRGERSTRAYRIQRLQCQDCAQWFDGSRRKI
jgi:hypothetical protein